MKKINSILLVDDNPADNYYNRFIIQDADLCDHIETALDGVEALDYLKRASVNQSGSFPKPDLVFLDINMPRVNGFEFLEEYKKLDDSIKSKVLIVMLTTSINPEDRQKALGFKEISEFINKPLTYEMLGEIIKKYFSGNEWK